MITDISTIMTEKTHFFHSKQISPTIKHITGDNTQQKAKRKQDMSKNTYINQQTDPINNGNRQ
jgi:hypothetical protein